MYNNINATFIISSGAYGGVRSMNIFARIFEKGDYIYCISCRRKKKSDCFFVTDGGAGICTECADKLHFTRSEATFDAAPPLAYIISPLEYKGAAVKILRDFKFSGNFKNGDILTKILTNFLCDFSFSESFTRTVPVPLSTARLKERGYNQSEILARGVAECMGVPLDMDVLIRTRNTERQSSLSNAYRAANVKNAFAATEFLKGEKIILVDDIYTTGCTLKSCAEALIYAGAEKVIGITAAKALPKNRRIN